MNRARERELSRVYTCERASAKRAEGGERKRERRSACGEKVTDECLSHLLLFPSFSPLQQQSLRGQARAIRRRRPPRSVAQVRTAKREERRRERRAIDLTVALFAPFFSLPLFFLTLPSFPVSSSSVSPNKTKKTQNKTPATSSGPRPLTSPEPRAPACCPCSSARPGLWGPRAPMRA